MKAYKWTELQEPGIPISPGRGHDSERTENATNCWASLPAIWRYISKNETSPALSTSSTSQRKSKSHITCSRRYEIDCARILDTYKNQHQKVFIFRQTSTQTLYWFQRRSVERRFVFDVLNLLQARIDYTFFISCYPSMLSLHLFLSSRHAHNHNSSYFNRDASHWRNIRLELTVLFVGSKSFSRGNQNIHVFLMPRIRGVLGPGVVVKVKLTRKQIVMQ